MLVIPIFVPHAGCPNDCVFCNQKIISGENKSPSTQEIERTVEIYREAAKRYGEVEIAFFGGSFTAISVELQEQYLETVQKYLKKNGGFVDGIRLSTRPDSISSEVAERLVKYGVTVVELGAQSMDDEVLKLSNRGHTAAATVIASRIIKSYGLTLGLQTMPGLPGSSFESDLNTARKIAELKPGLVRIYPTIVVKHTRLERDYLEGRFNPLTLNDAVKLTGELSKIYYRNNIKIIRMGLQSTDTISRGGNESEVVAGPYHESFGELVESYAITKEIQNSISEFLLGESNKYINFINIYVPKDKMSCTVGYKQENIMKIKDTFSAKHVKVLPYEIDFSYAGNPCFDSFCRTVKITNENTAVDRNENNKNGVPAMNISIYMLFNRQ